VVALILAVTGTLLLGSMPGLRVDAGANVERATLKPMSGSYDFTLTFDGLHATSTCTCLLRQPWVFPFLWSSTSTGPRRTRRSRRSRQGWTPPPTRTAIWSPIRRHQDLEGPDPDPVAKQAQYGWNAGQCCGLPVTRHIDDVGFLLKVISDVAARTPVDLRRVYVTGISNGG